MEFLSKLATFVTTYWPLLLALAAFTTGLSQFCNAIAAKWPGFEPIARFVGHLSVDFVEALKLIAKLLKKDPPDGPGDGTLKRISFAGCVLVALLIAGCGGSLEDARDARIMMGPKVQERDPYHCKSLDDQRELFTDAAWVDGSLGAASGAVAGALPSDTAKGWRIGLGAGAVAFGAMTVISIARGADVSTLWVKDCSDVTPAVQQ